MEPKGTETVLPVPLTRWDDGTIHVCGSRVTLDVIIHQFKLGDTAEQIQDCFPSLTLHDIYGAIFYYLSQPDEVEEYLQQQKADEQSTLRMIEEHPETQMLRERLRLRRHQLISA